jgi:hypothetical protein
MITLSPQEADLILATLEIPRELRDRLAAGGSGLGLNGDEIDPSSSSRRIG